MALLPIGQSPRQKQKLEIQPYPQDGMGRRRCFADGSGSGPAALGSAPWSLGFCSLKRGPTQNLPRAAVGDPFRPVVLPRAAAPAGLLLQTIQTP